MKIVDIKEVENGYWKLTVVDGDDNSLKTNPPNITCYYRNKELLINAVNSESSYDIALFADLVIDDRNSRVIKNRFGKIPEFADLVFSYIQNNT